MVLERRADALASKLVENAVGEGWVTPFPGGFS